VILTLLVKVSKLCNLRCTYCYETPELANKTRMSLDDIERMFLHVREYLSSWGDLHQHRLDLYWHGGEPFVQPISYWKDIIRLERTVFGARFFRNAIRNDVQSNLTRLTKEHLPLLRRYFSLGFSYDVINDMRVNVGGEPTAKIVREKVEWLLSEGISIGGIAVISKCNVDQSKAVADYFLQKSLSFRVLNVNEGHHIPQVRESAVPYDSYLNFLAELYRSPAVRAALEKGIRVSPLFQARSQLHLLARDGRVKFSKQECTEREWVLAVNTNGDVYPVGDCYNPEFMYGNVFIHTLDELLSSKARKRRVKRSRERLRRICHQCFLFRRACDGTFVSHATPEEMRDYDNKGECYQSWLARMMTNESA
jgi:uncharacterized protein